VGELVLGFPPMASQIRIEYAGHLRLRSGLRFQRPLLTLA
jgi:hypothetical protein